MQRGPNDAIIETSFDIRGLAFYYKIYNWIKAYVNLKNTQIRWQTVIGIDRWQILYEYLFKSASDLEKSKPVELAPHFPAVNQLRLNSGRYTSGLACASGTSVCSDFHRWSITGLEEMVLTIPGLLRQNKMG